ncbi:MAG: nitroreductase family deazaflavin-dependent oxidoreductase [Anaerolineaceae bacterium]|nr:nitroreductase family deazaflavin-dependent oxidoreductase [Anaerolineae bacterium]MCB9461471.1 nitroreductase family deazaflavin-dependent oxidoreductase [Anaerolineaceae bacterium]
MDERIAHALENDLVIDITTTGRISGEPRQFEIWFYNIDGVIYITGLPGKRDWYANMLANPHITFHLKESVQATIPARVEPIIEPETKRPIVTQIAEAWNNTDRIEEWLVSGPLVRVHLEIDLATITNSNS